MSPHAVSDVTTSASRVPRAPFASPEESTEVTDGIVSRSRVVREALDRISRVAPTEATVLITGETGTGKELAARAIHRRSGRGDKPLVTVNLSAIPDTLIASELFGHEQGAFTGATQRRIGRFEMADHGTLFLDEIGELSVDLQVLLLRALQEGEFERLGGSQTRRADVRLVAATHRNLEQLVNDGRFRADLFYRLTVFSVHIPPLRERREDIPLLVEYLLVRLHRRLGRRFQAVDGESMARLEDYDWPGNVRQLENVLEHAAILCDDVVLQVPAALMTAVRTSMKSSGLDEVLRQREQQMIEHALADSHGRIAGAKGAAARLGIPASTLESKIRRFGIDKFRYHSRHRT
jgi:formate hydrogenlyase transcriptional activator